MWKNTHTHTHTHTHTYDMTSHSLSVSENVSVCQCVLSVSSLYTTEPLVNNFNLPSNSLSVYPPECFVRVCVTTQTSTHTHTWSLSFISVLNTQYRHVIGNHKSSPSSSLLPLLGFTQNTKSSCIGMSIPLFLTLCTQQHATLRIVCTC